MKGDPVSETDGDELDEDEPNLLDQSPYEKIARLTEENMLAGWSQLRCYQFCIQFGFDRATFDRMWDDIKTSWKMPTMTFATFCEQRDLARARYTRIFNKAMKRNQLMVASNAVDKIVRLDGLDQPMKLELTLGQNSQITNAARDNVNQLMERMRQLAAPTDDGTDAIIEESAPEVPSAEPVVVRNTALNGYVGKPDKNGIIEIEGRYLPGDPRGKSEKS